MRNYFKVITRDDRGRHAHQFVFFDDRERAVVATAWYRAVSIAGDAARVALFRRTAWAGQWNDRVVGVPVSSATQEAA